MLPAFQDLRGLAFVCPAWTATLGQRTFVGSDDDGGPVVRLPVMGIVGLRERGRRREVDLRLLRRIRQCMCERRRVAR